MRICILTVGSRGDIEPYVALGIGLKAVGHDVRLATHEIFRETVTAHGLDFFPLEGNPQELMNKFGDASDNVLQLIQEQVRAMKALFTKLFEDAWEATQDAQLLISSTILIYVGCTIAEKRGIPTLASSLQPIVRTRDFPHPLLPFRRSLGKGYNLLTHDLTNQVLWLETRSATNALRRKLGLSAYPMLGVHRRFERLQSPILLAFSSLVVPRPQDWRDGTHITGYWFLDASPDWTPPADLVEFIQDGSPPVFVGFGSTSSRNPEQMTAMVLKSLELAGQRGVIATGWRGLSEVNLPDSVRAIDDVPFEWLFPHMAAVVHHGGAGTTANGFRAGMPTIVTPALIDHFFWGERAAALGVGPTPIPQKQLTAERLANAIRIAVNDQNMRVAATELGRKLRTEDGVARAVNAIEAIFSELSPRSQKGD